MTAAHSKWSASRFEQRLLCPGSHVLEQGKPDNANQYAAEGTAAHQLATWCVQQGKNADDWLGYVFHVNAQGRICNAKASGPPYDEPKWSFTVDEDMASNVQVCVDYVRDVAGADGTVIADIRVNYAEFLGVAQDDAWGTADFVILLPDEPVVVDLKYGRGVLVEAGHDVQPTADQDRVLLPNPQLACYGLGALVKYGAFQDFSRVRLVISQPRVSVKPSEFDMTVQQLRNWGFNQAMAAVTKCLTAESAKDKDSPQWADYYLVPGEQQCKFCKAQATCPKARDFVSEAISGQRAASPDEFIAAAAAPDTGNDEWLSAAFAKVDFIENWCKAVDAELNRRLRAGVSFADWKMVAGKKGNRAWKDEDAAEAKLKAIRLKIEEMYSLKLISPAQAEKLVKAKVIGPRQWDALSDMITQGEGKPHIAPMSDPRPALTFTPVSEDFKPIADAFYTNPEPSSDPFSRFA